MSEIKENDNFDVKNIYENIFPKYTARMHCYNVLSFQNAENTGNSKEPFLGKTFDIIEGNVKIK